jgi:hypothetical protein
MSIESRILSDITVPLHAPSIIDAAVPEASALEIAERDKRERAKWERAKWERELVGLSSKPVTALLQW